MEHQLHAWFRYTFILGIYLRRCPTAETNLEDDEIAGRIIKAGPYTKARRVWFEPQRKRYNAYQLKRFYVKALLIWIVIIHATGLRCRRRKPGAMLTWVVGTILFTSQAITNFLIIIETLWLQNEHEAFLAQLQNIEFSLKLRLGLDIRQGEFVKTLRLYLCYLLTFFFVGLALFLFSTFWLDYIGYFWYSFWYMIVVRLRLIQLLIYLRVLHFYMLNLATKLRQIVAYHKAPNLLEAKLNSHAYLIAIKDTHVQLLEAFVLFNKFAGWSLLLIISSYMLDISCNLYWSLLSLDGLVVRKNFYIAGIIWLCPLSAFIWHICQLSDECTQLERHIAHLLSKIVISSYAKELASQRLALQQFSTQLQLQCIQVSAKNVFNLNMQLLMTVSTSIAAYLAIIIQFLDTTNR